MSDFSEKLEKCYSTIVFTILTILCVGCALFQKYLIRDLKLPAGIPQAVAFYFKHCGEYFGAVIVGLIAWFIAVLLLVTLFVTFFGRKLDDFEFEKKDYIELAIKAVVVAGLFAVDILFATYTFFLLFVLLLIGIFGLIIVKAFADS
jgi:hypothetical protein